MDWDGSGGRVFDGICGMGLGGLQVDRRRWRRVQVFFSVSSRWKRKEMERKICGKEDDFLDSISGVKWPAFGRRTGKAGWIGSAISGIHGFGQACRPCTAWRPFQMPVAVVALVEDERLAGEQTDRRLGIWLEVRDGGPADDGRCPAVRLPRRERRPSGGREAGGSREGGSGAEAKSRVACPGSVKIQELTPKTCARVDPKNSIENVVTHSAYRCSCCPAHTPILPRTSDLKK